MAEFAQPSIPAPGSMALTYVTRKVADCDSPTASSVSTSRCASGPVPARSATPAWLKMSNENASPGCVRVP